MKSVILASCGIAALANLEDDTVLLQVRTHKTVDPMMPPAGNAATMPPMGDNHSHHHPPMGDNHTHHHPPMGDNHTHFHKPGPLDYFATVYHEENVLDLMFEHCEMPESDCSFFGNEIFPLLPDSQAVGMKVHDVCMEFQMPYDCFEMGEVAAENVHAAMKRHLMEMCAEMPEMPECYDLHHQDESFDGSAGTEADVPPAGYEFTPCELWNTGEVHDWETNTCLNDCMPAVWVKSAEVCEQQIMMCGQAPYCENDWVDAMDPLCDENLPVMFTNETEYWECTMPVWEQVNGEHQMCAKDYWLEFGEHHSGEIASVWEKSGGIDELCMMMEPCHHSEDWHQCSCDTFFTLDPEQFGEHEEYNWLDQECNDYGDETGSDGTGDYGGNDDWAHEYGLELGEYCFEEPADPWCNDTAEYCEEFMDDFCPFFFEAFHSTDATGADGTDHWDLKQTVRKYTKMAKKNRSKARHFLMQSGVLRKLKNLRK